MTGETKPNKSKRDKMMERSIHQPPVLAGTPGHTVLREDGTIDPVALNDTLVYLIMHVSAIVQRLTPQPGPPAGGQTKGGIILPGGGVRGVQ